MLELISFRIDWFDLLAVQETLLSLLQHHISKTSVLQHSAFFVVQISNPYMTTGKITALTIKMLYHSYVTWAIHHIYHSKMMSLLFNTPFRFVIAFPPRSKCLLISWLQSHICSDFGAPKIKPSLFPLFPHLIAMK